jgi:hypothetical protein
MESSYHRPAGFKTLDEQAREHPCYGCSDQGSCKEKHGEAWICPKLREHLDRVFPPDVIEKENAMGRGREKSESVKRWNRANSEMIYLNNMIWSGTFPVEEVEQSIICIQRRLDEVLVAYEREKTMSSGGR